MVLTDTSSMAFDKISMDVLGPTQNAKTKQIYPNHPRLIN